jgi:hypothetical protein
MIYVLIFGAALAAGLIVYASLALHDIRRASEEDAETVERARYELWKHHQASSNNEERGFRSASDRPMPRPRSTNSTRSYRSIRSKSER